MRYERKKSESLWTKNRAKIYFTRPGTGEWVGVGERPWIIMIIRKPCAELDRYARARLLFGGGTKEGEKQMNNFRFARIKSYLPLLPVPSARYFIPWLVARRR